MLIFAVLDQCLTTVDIMVQFLSIIHEISTGSALSSLKCMKFVFRPGLCPNSSWELTTLPIASSRLGRRIPLAIGRGYPFPFPSSFSAPLPPRSVPLLVGDCLHPSRGDGRPCVYLPHFHNPMSYKYDVHL